MIISVSRRTDIPAYYADWFRGVLEKGFTFYKNPFSGKPVYAALSPEAVDAFVFWTRNPSPLFRHLDYIDERYQKRHYMHFTINGLPKELEKRSPAADHAISSFGYLAGRYGADYAQWRFDPVVFSSVSKPDELIKRFTYIASRLEGMTRRCYFSFVSLYGKTRANFSRVSAESKVVFFKPSFEERVSFTKEISSIAKRHGITMYACVQDELLTAVPEIKKASCVDGDLTGRVFGNSKKNYRPEPSRPGCGCIESRDIGYYDSCPHGCIYCYANRDPEKALANAREYLREGFPFDMQEKP